MGLLCDLFVSTPDDAPKYAASIGEPAAANYPKGEWKGLTSLEFGTLWGILEGRDFDEQRHALTDVKVEGEKWLYRFPDAYVALLLALKGEQIEKVAVAWAATEELQWEPSQTQEVLEDMVRLAGLAKAKGKGLYFWGSL